MNKERYNQIIDEAYKNYLIEDTRILPNMSKEKMLELGFRLTKEEFITKCKTDVEFSERWGLKIEERELSAKERWDWYRKNGGPNREVKFIGLIVYENEKDNEHIHSWLKNFASNVPTKLITITYNENQIESYE